MKRKALALLLAAVMTTAMLAGCGKTQTGGSDGASQGTTPRGLKRKPMLLQRAAERKWSYHVGEAGAVTRWHSWKAAGGL